MKYTIIGDWYSVPDLASAFAVVAEGETYEEAKENAAEAVLEHFPHRADGEDGESPETLWGGDNGAYVVGAFMGDLSDQAIETATFELIA
ncbi:hypothetical protein [Streptomyces sp.]|uniref:hypothetical protein n=1 Tax=Streptomyces sp. TaxID=1931 RepID=UPI002D76CF90|nr:hypothetical protein [Streptomyces sp.]HET6354686.1 hypothetical protein [Streptomyces sp.]